MQFASLAPTIIRSSNEFMLEKEKRREGSGLKINKMLD